MQELASSPFAYQPRLVLVADYDSASRQAYLEYFSYRGLRVDEASDGREALAKAISQRPDIVVTETDLPGFSGYQLCSLLRQDVAANRTPIIMVTRDALETVSARAHDAGADVVLAKPCSPQFLLGEMRRLVRRSHELRTHAAAIRAKFARQLERSQELHAQIASQRRRALSKSLYRHDTTAPPSIPPNLFCPTCDRALGYQKSHVGGVSERYVEQWDYFICSSGCGTFQYRQRTRRLRRMP